MELHQNPSPPFDFHDKPEFIKIWPKSSNEDFHIHINKKPFFIDILKADNSKIIGFNHKNCFNSSPNISLDFDFDHEFLYGIPERAEKFLLPDTTADVPYRLYNLDRGGYEMNNRSGLYGSIPLLISPYPGKTMGLYWRNCSLTWVDIMKKDKKASCLWLSEAGDLEFYLIPANNVQDLFYKLGKLLGFATLPPYFSLGYHHSRWTFNDQNDLEETDKNFDLHQIPYDAIYLDIDYTDKMKYFTFDLKKFPHPLAMEDKLNEKGRNLVTIIDPHIKRQKGYFVYDEAVACNYFVKNEKKEDFQGSCWPGFSSWLDYLNSDVEKYWSSLYAYDRFVYSRPNTYSWNDMNEPSVFGLLDNTMPKTLYHKVKTPTGEDILVEHREIHNLYGFCQTRATYNGLIERNKDRNQRAFVLTRSFFSGSQKYGAVWTGDTLTKWEYLKMSLPMLLSMSVSGLSFCGSDIGGFANDPTDDLEIRWFQSAVVFPYFRSHSTKTSKRREPWLYEEKKKNNIKKAILLRYEIIPYLYTLFYEYTKANVPILRPLWYILPEKIEVYGVDDQMMMGDAILSCPILDEKQNT